MRRREDSRRIGIDLGGTKIEGVVLAGVGEVIMRQRVMTESAKGYDHIVDRVVSLAQELRRYAPECERLGIGTPGSVSARTGAMKNSNTTCLNDRTLPEDIALRLGLPVVIENDANCFALAEATAGAGRGANLVFGVILGTGVGGGFVYRGELLRGPQHLAGEWGHHCLDPAGPPCYCGQSGCVEAYIAGPAVAREYARRTGVEVDMGAIVDRAHAGEAIAREVLDAFLSRFGRALANVVDIIDPDVIVLGGGLSHIDELYTRGRAAVARCVFNDELRTPICRNQLGDSAGVIGAALLT